MKKIKMVICLNEVITAVQAVFCVLYKVSIYVLRIGEIGTGYRVLGTVAKVDYRLYYTTVSTF
jgi:hypothetical protein